MADAELVKKAVAGDAQALTDLLKLHGPAVRGRLTGKIGTPWRSVVDEDDVMQVTYMEAFLRINRFAVGADAHGSFLAWLSRIAENNLKDAIRELDRAKRPDPRQRVRAAPGPDSYSGLVNLLGVTHTTPSRIAAQDEHQKIIEEALDRLPKDYGDVIRLYDLEGREVEEVVQRMGRKSQGAVFMLRARAHDRLREVLGGPSQFFSNA